MANSEGPVLLSGKKTVTLAGTAEALVSASQRVKSVTIIAKAANTGQVYVGGADVAATTNDGLDALASLNIEAHGFLDLADIYINVGVSGEGLAKRKNHDRPIP